MIGTTQVTTSDQNGALRYQCSENWVIRWARKARVPSRASSRASTSMFQASMRTVAAMATSTMAQSA
jgi:hypothetical protein